MKNIIFIVALLIITSSCSTQSWNKLSNQIRKRQKAIMSQSVQKSDEGMDEMEALLYAYHICRKRLDALRKLCVDTRNDTLYILETDPNVLSSDKESTIFMRQNILSYRHYSTAAEKSCKYRTDSLLISHKPLYPKYMLRQAVRWDLESLEKESENHGMIPQDFIWLTRIIFKDKEYSIDCFRFKYFFDFKRDSYDDYEYKIKDSEAILKEIFD